MITSILMPHRKEAFILAMPVAATLFPSSQGMVSLIGGLRSVIIVAGLSLSLLH